MTDMFLWTILLPTRPEKPLPTQGR